MILLLDCGNTRLKWALKNEKGWLASDALPLADIGRLSELASRWPAPRRILLANVAGPDVATRIVNALIVAVQLDALNVTVTVPVVLATSAISRLPQT